ncbi:acetyl-coenzyme A carboxylase carboxyltransferase subunit beta [Striga asiatica]|uniref:Acetyl-coenzyme A carboxylase carboxyltransferase subunit beta n=1 Tax=Striga asiatica TaxID=4170 RepID=A0A5A7Q929_STRAF|nr:acetyl-coenzyme A carboxylase carboxyltransferase subunit beta [Striga asiatica]
MEWSIIQLDANETFSKLMTLGPLVMETEDVKSSTHQGSVQMLLSLIVLMYNPKLVWVIEVLKVWTRLQVLLAVWTKEELDAIKASQPKLYDDRPSKKKEE